MYTAEILFGLIGFPIFLITFRWAKIISERFNDDEELAATQVYLQSTIVSWLKFVAGSSVFLAVTAALSLYGLHIGSEILSNAIRAGIIVVFSSYVYFHFSVYTNLENK